MDLYFYNTKLENSNNSISKAIRKYTLEVDDAIEAHGFKAASYIDYAENTISDLENHLKKHYNENNFSFHLDNVKNSLDEAILNIVNHTKENTISRNNNYQLEKLDKKTSELYSSLETLNSRFLNSLNNI